MANLTRNGSALGEKCGMFEDFDGLDLRSSSCPSFH